MLQIVRQFLLVLVAFALIGGTALQPALANEGPAGPSMPDMPCIATVMHAGTVQAPARGAPCKGMSHDCLKQMGCVTAAALPVRSLDFVAASPAGAAGYWPARSRLDAITRAPEPLPPRTT